MKRNLKYIPVLSACLLLSCTKDEEPTENNQPKTGAENQPSIPSPDPKTSTDSLEGWIKDKRIYVTIPFFMERIMGIEFTKEGAMKTQDGQTGTYTVEDLKITTLGPDGSSEGLIVFPNAIVSKGDKIHTQPLVSNAKPRHVFTVVRVEDISETPKSFIEYEPNTNPAPQLGQGAIAKALENKRLHFGVHGFETNCVQFLSNGMVLTKGNDDPLIADTSLGQIVKLYKAPPRKMEMEYAFRFPKPTIQLGDKLMVFRGENLQDPYETFPVLVFKLEDLPSGGMADLIKGKRIYYESEGESNWVQFNKNGTAISKNSFHRILFSVDGLTVRIYKNSRDTITFTFKNQSLKVGDEMTKDENDSPQRTTQISISKVEPAGMPVGPPSEHQ